MYKTMQVSGLNINTKQHKIQKYADDMILYITDPE